MIYTCSDDRAYGDLSSFVNHALKLLDAYQFLTSSFMPEFFVEDQWNFLPANWRLAFETFTVDDVHAFLQNKQCLTNQNAPLPLSLLCFQRCSAIYKFRNEEETVSALVKGGSCDNSHRFNGQCIKPELLEVLDKFLNKHLKPKKRHEVDKLCAVIHSIADSNCKLFDVGSGHGHLSRRLAFKYDHSVVSVDTDSKLLSTASELDDRLIDDFEFLKSRAKPRQIHFTIGKQNGKQNGSELISGEPNFGLIGLHTCGNLSHDLLELHKHSNSRCLFLCSCCYHKTEPNRYLISKHLKKSNARLSMETRANACHSLDFFIDSFKSKQDELRVHTYRALIEYLLELKSPGNRRKTLSRVHSMSSKTFFDYMQEVFRKLVRNKELAIDELDLDGGEMRTAIESRLKKNLLTVIYFALRTLLGPVAESVLLADRMLFLWEDMKLESKLMPVYDSKISPRNFLLVSCRQ